MVGITLEGLLAGDFGDSTFDETKTPEEYAVETFDLMAEISGIASNITTFEAAKRIKAAKSKKKKVKVKKTKTTAKNARSMKKKNKRCKVCREDDDLTGGTGPMPTNTSSQGLTETDKEVDPDQLPDDTTVTVIEPVTSTGETITESTNLDWDTDDVSMESADEFMVIYEDADILQFEDEKAKNKTSLWQKIKALFQKMGDWFMSICNKIRNAFSGDKSLWERATKDMSKLNFIMGSSGSTLKIRPYKSNPFKAIEGVVSDIEKLTEMLPKIATGTNTQTITTITNVELTLFGKIKNWWNVKHGGEDASKQTTNTTSEVSTDAIEDAIKNFYNTLFGVEKIPAPTDVKLSTVSNLLPIQEMKGFLFDLPEKMSKASKGFKSIQKSAISKAEQTEGVTPEDIRKLGSIIGKGMKNMYKLYGAIRTDVRKILSAVNNESNQADREFNRMNPKDGK